MSAPPTPDRTETLAPRPPPQSDAAATTVPAGAAPVDDPAGSSGAPATDDPERYEQIHEHARGGLGRVVRAVDRRLGRTVAVKELLRHDPANEARFLREAMITARLEHPGIVPVHEAGRWPNGDPYYVMKLVEGRTLKELIIERATLRDRLGLLAHVIAVADAVGYAHSEGVIHRDLKPSNVIVGAFGETIVVDWGLARDRKRDAAEPSEPPSVAAGSGLTTVSGKVVGTPAYMSPEQARGDVVDERADVYALGAVLYELLAGTPPHADATPQAVLDRVIAGPPRPLTMVVPSVPGELATIVKKAMARDPAARYPNAIALAEDLRRFTTGKLVSAHSYSTWALVRRRLARHRGVVAVVLASLVVLGAVGIASVRRVVAERNIARKERAVAEDAALSLGKRKRELLLLQAETALPKDPTAALAWLKSFEIHHDDLGKLVDVIDEAMALGVARHVFRPGDWVIDAQFSVDGTQLIVAVRNGVIRAYDLATGAETEIGRAPSSPEAMALSPDGELVVTGGMMGEVIAWPLHGGAPRALVEATGRMISDLKIADDRVLIERESTAPQVVALAGGNPSSLAPSSALKFAVADEDWSRVVMTTSANEVAISDRDGTRFLARTERAIEQIAISPCGDTVLIHDGMTIWSVPATGGALRALARYDDKLRSIVWSPDRGTIALAGVRPEILLVDVGSGAVTELRGHSDALYMLEFSRDGTQLLSASDDATARVWQVATHTSIVLLGHDDDVFRAHFSDDGRIVSTASLDGSARLWPIHRETAATYSEGAPIDQLDTDGDDVVTRTGSAVAHWNLDSNQREVLFTAGDDAHGFSSGIVSADGEHLVIPNPDGSLELRRHGRPTVTLRGHRGLITHLELSRDGNTLYSSSSDGSLRRWDLATGAGTVLLQGAIPIRGFAVARDGRIAAQTADVAYLISAAGAVTRLGKGGAWCVVYAEFEPVNDRLVLHRCDKKLAIVDAGRPGAPIELSTGEYGAGRVATSPDGRRIAAGVGDRTVRLWDASTGQVLEILHGHSDMVLDVAFSPDGTKLASASYDKTIQVWDLATKRHRVLRGHAAAVTRVAWRGSNQLVTGSPDGTIRVWDVPNLELPSTRELSERLNAATSAQIDNDRPASTFDPPHGT